MLTLPPVHVCVVTELRTELPPPHHHHPPPPAPAPAATLLPNTDNDGQEDPELAVKIFRGINSCALWDWGPVQTMLCTGDSGGQWWLQLYPLWSAKLRQFPVGEKLAVILIVLQNTNVLVLQTLRPGINYIYCVIQAVQGCNTLRENMDPIHLCLVKI